MQGYVIFKKKKDLPDYNPLTHFAYVLSVATFDTSTRRRHTPADELGRLPRKHFKNRHQR